MLVWLQFLFCVAVIGAAGYRLSLFGDVIAEKTGLGRNWTGLVLLASVTSLPELVTGISAVTAAAVPNIAVGDALGSCVFNLMLIVLLDFLHRGEAVYTRASVGHALSAGFGTLLIGVVAINILLAEKTVGTVIGHVGFDTPLILILYVFAMRTVFRYEQHQIAAGTEVVAARYPQMTLRNALFGYSLASVSAMMMNGVAVVGLLYRPATRLFGAGGWASLLLIVIYLLNSMALFLHDD